MTLEIDTENILVLKTNIKSDSDFLKIKIILDLNDSINEWSIDREDKDCILRVESNSLSESKLIELVVNAGFLCEELND